MAHPLGIFIRIDEGLEQRLLAAQKLQLPTAQILAPNTEERTADKITKLAAKFKQANIQITVVFCGFEGESYASIPAVKETVGLVPLETRHERLQEAKAIANFARALDVHVVALHIGVIPKATSRDYQNLVQITRDLCDHCRANEQHLHLETGQESAEHLKQFMLAVSRENLAINFDPANMILYGSGEPIVALKQVARWVKSLHCKDANWSANPGIDWGEEVPLGEGQVDMEKFFHTLKEISYDGPLTIEREIGGEKQLQDIARAVKLLHRLRTQVWGE